MLFCGLYSSIRPSETFIIVPLSFPADTSTKRKIDASPGQKEPEAKQVKIRDNGGEHIGDLIVLGLPFKADEREMRSYFGQYGEISFVQVRFLYFWGYRYMYPKSHKKSVWL